MDFKEDNYEDLSPSPSEVDFDVSALSWAKLEVLQTYSEFTTIEAMDDLADRITLTETPDRQLIFDGCHPREPICNRPSKPDEEDYFFMYEAVINRIGAKIPFTSFECAVLTTLNVAPSQMLPNGWGFMRAFQILCRHHQLTPTCRLFFFFFKSKKDNEPGTGWVSLSTQRGQRILDQFLKCFKYFKNKFFKIMVTADLLFDKEDGSRKFPLYWTSNHPQPSPAITFEMLNAAEREVVRLLKSIPPVKCADLLRLENQPKALQTFIGTVNHELLLIFHFASI